MKKVILPLLLSVLLAGCEDTELIVESGRLTVVTTTTFAVTEPEIEIEPAPSREPPPDYVAASKKYLTEEHGRVYVGMADLSDPDGYRHIDNPGIIHPASLIKCMIMEYAFLQIEAGDASADEIVDGFALLHHIERMIQLSDNESTGSIIARFGRGNIDGWLAQSYENTRLYSDWRGYNHENRYNESTVKDMVDFLIKLYQNKDTEPYGQMLEIMFGTTFSREKIPAATDSVSGVRVANKTGSFADGENTADHDMAVVIKFNENDEIEFAYALVFYSFSSYIEETYSSARPAIIDMAAEIYERVAEYESRI